MKLTNAYIIDGDVIEKAITELKQEREKYFSRESNDAFNHCDGAIQMLEDLKQHLKPALPIVEKAFKAGEQFENDITWLHGEKVKNGLQDFLTKDF